MIPEPSSALWLAIKQVYNSWPPDNEDVATTLAGDLRTFADAAATGTADVGKISQELQAAWPDQAGVRMSEVLTANGQNWEKIAATAREQANMVEGYARALTNVKNTITKTVSDNDPLYYLIAANPDMKQLRVDMVNKLAMELKNLVETSGPYHPDAALADRLIAIARGELGTEEEPPGSNISKYGRWYAPHESGGADWCGRFVSWVYDQAGQPLPDIQGDFGGDTSPTGFQYVPKAKEWAEANGKWHEGTDGVQPGDIVIIGWDDGGDYLDHTGIATGTQRADGSVPTIEGNADERVGEHTRSRTVVKGYIRP